MWKSIIPYLSQTTRPFIYLSSLTRPLPLSCHYPPPFLSIYLTEGRTWLTTSFWHAVIRAQGRRYKFKVLGEGVYSLHWICRLWLLYKGRTVYSPNNVSCTSLIIYCGCVWKCCKLSSWHFVSSRWKSFEIHYLENAIGMNHLWADQTWLCILLLQCSIAHMSIKIFCHQGQGISSSSKPKTAGFAVWSWRQFAVHPADFISSTDWWGVPLYLITQRS